MFARQWKAPVIVIATLVIIVGAGLGHHIYYQSLHDTAVLSDAQQTWAIRIGSALAIMFKQGLVILLGAVAVQKAWDILRRKPMGVSGIDKIFAVAITQDPIALLSSTVLGHGLILVLLTVLIWGAPLIAVFTPAALSVSTRTAEVVTPMPVRTVNFTDVQSQPPFITTSGAANVDGPGFALSRIFAAVYTSGSFLPQPAPAPNSSYRIEFSGPAQKCQTLLDAAAEMDPVWNASTYPTVRAAHVALLPDRPNHLIYSGLAPTKLLNNTIFGRGEKDESRFVCRLYSASYVLSVRYVNDIMTIVPVSVEHVAHQNWGGGGNYLLATVDTRAAFFAFQRLFEKLLAGNITRSVSGNLWAAPGLGLEQSVITDCPETPVFHRSGSIRPRSCPGGQDLPSSLESLSRNLTYSLLAYPAWERFTVTVPVTTTSPQNYYRYDMRTLVLTYGSGVAVALAALLVLFLAMRSARGGGAASSDFSFSSILLATRNPDLDALMDASLAADGSGKVDKAGSKSVAGARLRFGVLKADGRRRRVFGLDGTVVPLKEYCRLQRHGSKAEQARWLSAYEN